MTTKYKLRIMPTYSQGTAKVNGNVTFDKSIRKQITN